MSPLFFKNLKGTTFPDYENIDRRNQCKGYFTHVFQGQIPKPWNGCLFMELSNLEVLEKNVQIWNAGKI